MLDSFANSGTYFLTDGPVGNIIDLRVIYADDSRTDNLTAGQSESR